MNGAARITLVSGIVVLALAIFNWFDGETITPGFQRAEVLAGLSGVGLMLVSILWSEVNPQKSLPEEIDGNQGFQILESLPLNQRTELAWGSQLILTATPAASILVYWQGSVILHRGILGDGKFEVGEICSLASKKGQFISLVNTALYPGKSEFDSVAKGLPSIIVCPLDKAGFLIVGGWSKRCFSKSDETWIEGWSRKLVDTLID